MAIAFLKSTLEANPDNAEAQLDEELWHRSGHWDNYRENMYFTEPSEARAGEERASRSSR